MVPEKPYKILVVDDEPQLERLVRQRFRSQIKEGRFDFHFAFDGLDALEMVRKDATINMLLCDINMPRLDGLSLLETLREEKPLLKTVIVSAYGDMKNIRIAMNRGAFDFITKPIDFADLEVTIIKTLDAVAELVQSERAKALEGENQKLQEIDRLKTEFFTNISHEFRTPLTIIRGMAEQIVEKPKSWLHQGVTLIQRNTDQLLDLVNQILELRKLEAGKLKLNIVQMDLVPLLNYLASSYETIAQIHDIEFHYSTSVTSLVMDFDRRAVSRIIQNVLSNAIKFTSAGGKITLQVRKSNGALLISIEDTGSGIRPEALPHIFERFFRGSDHTGENMGTGIGLALAYQLVHAVGGQISVESVWKKGSTFLIKLPIHTASETTRDRSVPSDTYFPVHEPPELAISNPSLENDLPTILIIEDNREIADYLGVCLESRYHLTFAVDGNDGVEKASAEIPDLVICDVMMPEKDGFEVCKILKEDLQTNHIPIILLTAKADETSKLSGLAHGADAYLTKPFDRAELLIRIQHLLELRTKLHQRYSSVQTLAQNRVEKEEPQDEFILSVHRLIHENLDNENFSIHQLGRAIGASRTQMHRKIKALTGKSTSLYIRSLRLEKAKDLLANSKLNISQVAYEVGFKDAKYFSRTFTDAYGMSPKAWRK